MKKMTLEEWEKKYIGAPIECFDQKNRVNMRAEWDPKWGPALGPQNTDIEVQDRPGYRRRDWALYNAARSAGRFAGSRTQPETFEGAAEACRVSVKFPDTERIDVDDIEKVTLDLKKVAVYFGADRVGVCRLDRRWIYSHSYKRLELKGRSYPDAVVGESRPLEIPDEFQFAVVMVVHQDYNLLKYSPTMISASSNYIAYTRLANANNLLSAFVQNLGYQAVALPTHQIARHIPIAMQAGLGDIGRNGLLVTPEFGPRVKIVTMLTDLPLAVDSPIDLGLTEFCEKCGRCARVCPAQALPSGGRTAEPNNASNSAGELKWRVNAERCAKYWIGGHRGCNTCVACCPFNKVPGSKRYNRLLEADSFWDEWKPVPYGVSTVATALPRRLQTGKR
ncbi:MAG: reductive dehalogenase [Thermodesulfobacteriota bacterium]